MPTTMYAKVRRVLVLLWLVRNSEANYLSTNAIQRRTGLDHRTVRRILAMLRRRGLIVSPAGATPVWMASAKGLAYARLIQDRYEAADNEARRLAYEEERVEEFLEQQAIDAAERYDRAGY